MNNLHGAGGGLVALGAFPGIESHVIVLLSLVLCDQFVKLLLRVLGPNAIDQIAELVRQTTVVHIGGNTGS